MKYLIFTIIGVIFGLGVYYVSTHFYIGVRDSGDKIEMEKDNTDKISTTTSVESQIISDVGYLCDEGKTVHAVYFPHKVIIELSGGRAAQLTEIISESEVRYANLDKSIVFLSKGAVAFVEEGGKKTYANCNELDTSGVEMQ